jgi:hypothetical protein
MKPWSKIQPEYYVCVTDSWIMYPWEVRETVEHLIRIWRDETKDLNELRARLVSSGISSILIDRYLNPKNLQGQP